MPQTKRNQPKLNNKKLLTDEDWNRIYKEKFEDPHYYSHSINITPQSSLNTPKHCTESGFRHASDNNEHRKPYQLGYLLRGHSKLSY